MHVRVAIIVGAASLLFASQGARAHHSFSAEFDVDQPLKLSGTLTKMEWTNPHCWFYMDVKGNEGQVINWAVEAGTPNALLRLGFTKNTLKPGTVLVVDGFRAKDASNRANGFTLTTEDGRKLFLASMAPNPPKQ